MKPTTFGIFIKRIQDVRDKLRGLGGTRASEEFKEA
jgi:hypothetical protein